MPIDRQRYPNNWRDIARSIKETAGWRCQKCNQQCLRPGEDISQLSRRERTVRTLNVHHANRTPEDNRVENLIAVCTVCHLAAHTGGGSNVFPGHLSLWWKGLDQLPKILVWQVLRRYRSIVEWHWNKRLEKGSKGWYERIRALQYDSFILLLNCTLLTLTKSIFKSWSYCHCIQI